MPFAFGPASTPLAPSQGPYLATPKYDTRGLFYKQDFEVDPLATIFDDAVGSTASIDPSNAKFNAKSLLIQQYGTPTTTNRNIPTVNQASQVLVGRFWVNFVNDVPNVLQQIANLLGVDVNINFNWTSGNHITIGFAGNFTDFGLMAQKTWHSIDFRADARPRPNMTVDLQVDGVPGAQSTVAVGATPGPWTKIRFGQSGANTIHFWIDGLQLSDNYNNYPLADDPTWAPFVPYVASFTFPHVREIFDPSRIAPLIAPLQQNTTPAGGAPQIYTDAATATLTLTASAVETAQFVDSATAQLNLVASASVEGRELTDSTTATLTNVASATETAQFVDATTAALSLVASGAQVFAGIDAATAQLTLTPSASEVYTPNIIVYVQDFFSRTSTTDIGTASPTGGTYTGDITSYLTDGSRCYIDTPTAGKNVMQAGSAANNDEYIDWQYDTTPTGGSMLAYLGIRVQDENNQWRAGFRVRSTSHLEVRLDRMESGTIFTLVDWTDTGIVTTTGTDYTFKTRIQDHGDGTVDLFAKAWLTSGTEPSSWTISTNDTTVPWANGGWMIRHNRTSTNAIRVSMDNYNAVSVNTTSSFTYTDADTAFLTFSPSAAETQQAVDSTTAQLSLVASASEIYTAVGNVDASTARLTLTPSGVDAYYVDTAQVLLLMQASAVEKRGYTDLATANLTFTPSATEVRLFNDVATALLTFAPTEIFPLTSFVDSATATLKLVTSAVDTQLATDFCLEGTPYMMWTSKMVGYSWTNSTLGFAYVASNLDHWESRLVGRCPV